MKTAILAVTLLATSVAMAQTEEGSASQAQRKIGIGDSAPELHLDSWVQGDEVTKFEKGKVYVLDFWATWCGPCIAAMPHMTETQKKYADKGVQVIGVAIWQPDFSEVKPFVSKNKERMGYSVAIESCPPHPDDMSDQRERFEWSTEKGKMSQEWMMAAGRNGIPSIFIVDQNQKIAWMGHPMDGMDAALEKIVAGTYDLAGEAEKYRKAMAAEGLKEEFAGMVRAGKHTAAFKFAARHLDGAFNDDANFLNFIAWEIVDPEGSVENKDLELAMRAAKRADELTERKSAAIVDTLARVHFCKGEVAQAVELQKVAVSLAEGEMKAELEKALDEYLKKAEEAKKKPERASF